MNAIVFYIFFPLIFILSLLPLGILYFISDFFYFLLYHIIGYRRNVVRQNLLKSFPDKTEIEIENIEKKFYRHLCDVSVETIKLYSLRKDNVARRCSYSKETVDLFASLNSSGKDIVIAMGHCGNWEYAGLSMSIHSEYNLQVVYRPIKNTYFDNLIYTIRSRFGALPLPMNLVAREFHKRKEKPTATAFIADQSAPPENSIWLNFLNQETTVFNGVEKIATKFNLPVVYAGVVKLKRGFYEVRAEILSEDPNLLSKGELTGKFMKRLENQIEEQPEYWLWSHRRWKHKKPEGIKIEVTGK